MSNGAEVTLNVGTDDAGSLDLSQPITIEVSQGAVGPAGRGIPAGGTITQSLVKASDDDYDTEWVDAGAGGGAVDSVNSHTGVVILGASDVGAQPVDSDLTAIAALSTTPFGRALLVLADAGAGRTAFGLGTAATSATSDFDAAGAAATAQAASQPVDSDLTAIAALTTTSFGRGLLALADAAAGRTALGLGTAAVAASTDFDAAGAAATAQAASQPVDSDLTAIAALATTPFGRGLLTQADAAAARSDLGLGSAALSSSGDFDVAGAAASAQAASQPVDSDLTAIAALTTTSFGRGLLASANAAALRTSAGVVIGTDVEAHDADLTAIAALDSSTSGAIASDGAGWIKKTYAQFKTALGLVKADVGLGSVDNTADAAKTITGDVTGTLGGSGVTVIKIRAGAVDSTAPTTNGMLYLWDNDAAKWVAKSLSGDATIDKAGVVTLVGSANVESIIRANTLDQMGAPAANLSANSKRIINVADQAAATDALNRQSGDARYQPLDSDLTTLAGLTATTDNFLIAVASAWASRTPAQARTTLGLVIGTNVQAWDADLDALSAGAGWLADANTWTVHVVPTQAGMTTVVAAGTVGHAGLTYTNGDAVIVTGLSTTTGPINGGLYYIIGQTSTTVQLANSPGGTAIVFGGTADSATVTLTGVNQFTVPVDATGYLGPSTKISYNDGGVDYGIVATAKNNSGTTTVTLIPNNDYSIANATLTAPRFSYAESPVGFPASFAFSPVFVGYSTAGPTLKVYTWKTVGRTLFIILTNLNTATSNAVTHTMSIPIASVGVAGIIWSSFVMSTDSGTVQPGQVTVGGSAQFATINGKITGGNTASGNSAVNGIVTYEF